MSEDVTPSPIEEPVSVDDNAGSLTVDNAGLTELAAAIDTELQVDVVGALPAGDNNVGNVDIASPLGAGTEAAALRVTVATDSTGVLSVDDNGGALTVDGTVTANLSATDNAVLDQIELNTDPLLVVGGGTEATAQRVTIASDSTGVVSVDDNGGALTVDGTVTANLSATDNAVLDNIDADTSAIQTAVEIIDNSVFVDDADWTADTSSHTLVGAVTEAAPLTRTDGDTHPLATDLFGHLRVGFPETDLANASSSHVKKYYTSAGAATDGIIWSPAAGKRWYVQTMYINISAAATVTLEDDLAGGDSPVFKSEFAANSGVAINFTPPLYSGEDAADLLITTTAGNVYVTITGYEI